jgi:hypothetical protein
MAEYDLVVRNVDVVRHDRSEPERSDIAISSGRIARVAPRIGRTAARDEVDGEGMLALPLTRSSCLSCCGGPPGALTSITRSTWPR